MMNKSRTSARVSILVAGMLTLALIGAGCASNGEEETSPSTTSGASDAPQVSEVWARAAMEGGNTAIYFVVDGGSAADRLVAAAVPDGVGETTEIHETVAVEDDSMDDEADDHAMGGSDDMADSDHGDMAGGGSKMMTMRPVEAVEVPAGARVVFEPGGYHVMVLNLDEALVAGEELPVTLTFEKAGDIEVVAEVREP